MHNASKLVKIRECDEMATPGFAMTSGHSPVTNPVVNEQKYVTGTVDKDEERATIVAKYERVSNVVAVDCNC